MANKTFLHSTARQIMAAAYQQRFGKPASGGELDFACAVAYFESGYGRAGMANWVATGQFAKWAANGQFNYGALESGTGPDGASVTFLGIPATMGAGADAGRSTFFYLFASDLQAANAFLGVWGKPDTLTAAQSGSPTAVAAAMKAHGYYEGFWVPTGNPQGKPEPPFKEDPNPDSKNIADYAAALTRYRSIVTGGGGVPDPSPDSYNALAGVPANTAVAAPGAAAPSSTSKTPYIAGGVLLGLYAAWKIHGFVKQ
jgi:hypothetical protein